MPTTSNVSSGYSGALAGEIFVEAFKKSDTLSKNAITFIPNVIGNGFMPKLSYSAGLTAYSCGFDPSGAVDYTDKEVPTKKFKIDHELCKEDFHQTFQAQSLGLFSAKAEIPASIQEAILTAITNGLAETIETQIWQGNNSANQFNGLLPQFVADADVIDVTVVASTPATVVAQIQAVYDAIPAEIEDDSELVIVVAKNVAKAYRQAQASMGLNTTVGVKELDYLGTRMESLAGLPANSILAYRVKNVGFLTGIEADYNSVQVKDMDESDLSGNIRTKVVFSGGVGYSFGSEIVYGRTA